MGDFQKVVDDKRAEFVSFREVLDKLAADTGDGLKTIAEALRIKRIHWEGGARYKPGILIDGGTEEEPLGMLLEQTAETGLIPERCGWLAGSEWGPDNIGWHRAELVERLRAAGLPSPCSLLVTSEQYAPTTPPSASEPAVELTQAESAAQVMPVAVGMPAPNKKPKRSHGVKLVNAVVEILEIRARKEGTVVNRSAMKGTRNDFYELAKNFHPDAVPSRDTFFDWLKLAGVKFMRGARPTGFYRELFPMHFKEK